MEHFFRTTDSSMALGFRVGLASGVYVPEFLGHSAKKSPSRPTPFPHSPLSNATPLFQGWHRGYISKVYVRFNRSLIGLGFTQG